MKFLIELFTCISFVLHKLILKLYVGKAPNERNNTCMHASPTKNRNDLLTREIRF